MVGKTRRLSDSPIHFATATLAFVAAASAQAAFAPAAPGEAMPAEIKISSTEFKYVPAKIRAAAGRPVTLVLDNSGAETEHGIFVPAIGFRLDAKAGENTRKTVVFDKAGEFEFSCDLPGHREAGMKGLLIVGQGGFPDSKEETNASIR